MSGPANLEARCFCSGVVVKLEGAPEAMGYCHCRSCRQWSAGPVNAFSLWSNGAVEVVQGADLLDAYSATPQSIRKWCTRCGGHVLTEHPEMGLIDVYAVLVENLDFTPALHVHCGEAVIAIADDLPKFRNLPAEMGGSGEQVEFTKPRATNP